MISTQYMAVGSAALAVLVGLQSGMEVARVITSTPAITATASLTSEAVNAGAVTFISWSISKSVDCPGWASRVWSGEGGFHMSEMAQATSIPKGDGVYNIPTVIPDFAPAGRLELSIRGHFDCDEGKTYFNLGPVVMDVLPRKGYGG